MALDFDFRLRSAEGKCLKKARSAEEKGRSAEAARLHAIAARLGKIAPEIEENERHLQRIIEEIAQLAELRQAALERGREANPNFALLCRNRGDLYNAAPKLYLPVDVDGVVELVEAFGIDLLASGKQLVGFHLHPDTGRPWLWRGDSSPETVSLASLPELDAAGCHALWSEIAAAARALGLIEKRDAPRPHVTAGGSGKWNAGSSHDKRSICDFLAARWPFEGSRHAFALALGGFLVRCGCDEEAIIEIVGDAADMAGDEEKGDRIEAAKSAVSASDKGRLIAGKRRLAEFLGPEAAETLSSMCGYKSNGSLSAELSDAVERLAALPSLEYDQVRHQEAEKLGVRVPTLDEEVKRRRPKSGGEDGDKAGRSLTFENPEPWPEPVNGAELIQEIADELRRYVMMPSEAALAVALWLIHAHCFELFCFSPRLAITSPEKRCGKTTLLTLIKILALRSILAANITSAAMFRTIERFRPTLLIDEADSFLAGNEELRGVVNSGHSKDGAVIRLVGDEFEPRSFSTFCPTAIAAIGSLPATIEDRAVIISMRRRLKTEKVERLRGDRPRGALLDLPRKIARWVEDNAEAMHRADPVMPEELSDRACDNWRPLLAIADVAGPTMREWRRWRCLAMKTPTSGRRASCCLRTYVAFLPREPRGGCPIVIVFPRRGSWASSLEC